jgi:hypothetical protein
MADNGASSVNSMVSGLNASIEQAVARLQAQANSSQPENVKEYQKSVRKSSGNTSFYSTDIGILAKNTTRLNVVSNLAANDAVDFYKFKVTTKGEASMGMMGDDGVRVQLMSKNGMVLSDNDKSAGKAYDNYLKLSAGELSLDRGDYTVRVSRTKDAKLSEDKNYALQFQMGSYSQDFDTVAKQARKGDSPFQLSAAQQSMMDGLTNALSNAQSISYGQSGTAKLMGSFSLFV